MNKIIKTQMKLNLIIPPEPNHYVYVILPVKLYELNNFVCKYGKTCDALARFMAYGKNSVLLFLCRVKDCHLVEDEIAKIFKIHFQQEPYGREYFRGDVKTMIDYINQIIDRMGQRMEDNMIDEIKETYREYLIFNFNNVKNIPGINLKEENIDDCILNESNQFACKICKKKFATKENLRYHETNKVCIDKEHACEYCGNTFTTIMNKQRHINHSCRVKKDALEKEKYEKEKEKKEREEKDYEEKIAKAERYNKLLKLELENKKILKEIEAFDSGTKQEPNSKRNISMKTKKLN